MLTEQPLRILIADDNNTDRMILAKIVSKMGHEVISASDGMEAVEQFNKEKPELILLDALMPNMDGMEAAKIIKEEAGDELVPIIFLTSLVDDEGLANCLDSGGDDFLSKPYSRTILEAKIGAFARMREMHRTLKSQRDQISLHNEHMLREQKVAMEVFQNVTQGKKDAVKNIRVMQSPFAVFNGDIVLSAFTPSGRLYVLLGDFTGHGLPAAIGAMPMAEIFYGMVGKGFAMREILREINQKLQKVLPVGFFCCACMLDMNFTEQTIEIWNGGLPDCFLYRSSKKEIEPVVSNHLPLGVLGAQKFRDDTTVYEMDLNDRFFMWSDGIFEARSETEELFGEERLRAVFDRTKDPAHLFDDVKNAVAEFIGDTQRDDDISMAEVVMVAREELGELSVDYSTGSVTGPTDWRACFDLGVETLKVFNPLPLIVHNLMETPGLRTHNTHIYTILSELYSNALEHGVMGLDSALKADAAGFAEYYMKRAEAQAKLEDGFVRFNFEHKPNKNGGKLVINVEDSGPGFDYVSKIDVALDNKKGYSGRGIPLISTLAESVVYKGEGNIVEVVYNWSHDSK